jgi:hypothetical protein
MTGSDIVSARAACVHCDLGKAGVHKERLKPCVHWQQIKKRCYSLAGDHVVVNNVFLLR